MLDKKVGVAVVGAGLIGGQAYVPTFNRVPESELVTLGDQVEEWIKKYVDKYHVKYYLDYDQLLNYPKVQAVVLAVPTPFHYEMSIKAIGKGKHVLCEMSLAPRASEAERLGEEAEDKRSRRSEGNRGRLKGREVETSWLLTRQS